MQAMHGLVALVGFLMMVGSGRVAMGDVRVAMSATDQTALISAGSGQCQVYSGYPTTCQNVTGCAYCCQTHQCFPTATADNSTCNPEAVLPQGLLCDDVCSKRIARRRAPSNSAGINAECEVCTAVDFCLYCPYDYGCYARTSIQCSFTMWDQCDAAYKPGSKSQTDTDSEQILPYAIWGCVGIAALCIVVPLVRWVVSKVQSRVNQRREARQRQQFREDQRRRAEQAANAQPTVTGAGAGERGTVNNTDGDGDEDEQRPLLAAAATPGGGSGGGREGTTTAAASEQSEAKEESKEKDDKEEDKASTISSFDDADACQLCLDRPATVVYLPCYHQYCCEDCSEKLRSAYRRREGHGVACPFCRQRIHAMVSMTPMHPVVQAAMKIKRD